MIPIILSDVPTTANTWVEFSLPDKARDSIRFQAKSLGVLDYSFDGGVSYLQTVGAGEYMLGNFSLKTIWFRTITDDAVKIAVQDKLW